MTAIWKRVGTLERAGNGLRVTVHAFGKTTTGFISPTSVRLLLSPGNPAADVMAIREGVDGEVTQKIGYARRSQSGKGIIVHLITAPECSGSWGAVQGLLHGIRDRVVLSVLEDEKPFRAEPVKAPSLADGMSSRF